MFKEYLLLLLLGHILGDFYTQTAKIAEKKKDSLTWVLKHCLIYFITIFIVSIPVISFKIFLLNVITAFLHALIDIIKYLYLKHTKKSIPSMFFIDQSLHLLCLLGMSYLWTKCNIQLNELHIIQDIFKTVGISEVIVCKWLLGLLIIHKPANILIQNIIGTYKPKTNPIEINGDNNIGRIIGTVERVIMLMLISMKQYSAIGLVLTAKSIARYDRISKDEKFAEYYLLGTLISTGIVIACSVILF